MGLLDKLWDDTVAGPQPENGLGKLRKYSTFSFRQSLGKESDVGNVIRSNSEDLSEEAIMKVTRSIMIIKPPNLTVGNGSPPISPAGSTTPVSPFFGGRERVRWRSTSDDVNERSGGSGGGPRGTPSP